MHYHLGVVDEGAVLEENDAMALAPKLARRAGIDDDKAEAAEGPDLWE